MSRIFRPGTRHDLKGLRQGLGFPHLRRLSFSDKGCVLYAPLNSLPNGISPDLSGKGNNGVNHGAALVDIGESYPVFWKNKLIDIGGKALSFDGVDDYIDCGNGASLDITDTITIEVWMKQRVFGAGRKIVSRRNLSAFYFLGVDSGRPYAGIGDGTNYSITLKSFTVPVGEWHYLVFVFVDTDNEGYIYYDGVLRETSTLLYSIGDLSGIKLSIGADSQGASAYFPGLISGVRIYNRALSPMEIKAHFDLTRVLFGV